MKVYSDGMQFQLDLRSRGISDQTVLRAMELVPRTEFVQPADRSVAYRDTALGIACGQTISQPFLVAYMTQQLDIQSDHRVLEIGTGSGYQAAILGRLAREVVTVERFATLVDLARERLQTMRIDNVEIVHGDGYDLSESFGAFDRILVTAAMERVPTSLLAKLAAGGLLIAPEGPLQGPQTLMRMTRDAFGTARKPLLDVRFVPALRGIALAT